MIQWLLVGTIAAENKKGGWMAAALNRLQKYEVTEYHVLDFCQGASDRNQALAGKLFWLGRRQGLEEVRGMRLQVL